MSLFAIADLHLSFGTNKPMDIFRGWDNYLDRLESNWRQLINDDDTIVIAGDISWAMNLEQAKPDFSFINSLPGQKLIIKGNHDYWWTTRRKMEEFFHDNGFDSIRIVHNSAEAVGEFAVCGTRGWFFDAEEDADKKIVLREVGRLDTSINEALKTGKEPVVFLHYPPVLGEARCVEILSVLLQYKIRLCYFGHIHGPSAQKIAPFTIEETTMRLISCDAVDFTPVLVR
ncbi:MAG: serine/threonine protein phosphatase [Clostridiales bacterium]|jgi:predicted phosphohydrolase|nr:serine/threonine protein phosphatase [Clostridiales bacterium]